MSRPVVNLDDLRLFAHAHGEKFAGKGARIGSALGARRLGYGLTELPPGKAACVSSIAPTDVVDFPDSGKVMVNVGDGTSSVPRMHVFRRGEEVDYWDGE